MASSRHWLRVPWETFLKGKVVQEDWTFIKTEVLKSSGTGYCHAPHRELSGKMTSLAEQGAFAGTEEKKGEFTIFGRKGRQLRKSTGILLGHAERKLERQKLS